ncbi:MBL fold metallo-hydrolase [Nocardioides mesophilus]|uniref:MBL fold metallo-hydrolase n=1 Tax=Nocardioides mesophilus TaxID=433659 RepID=A0A7G9REH9_9ACTN|nr:MBL fold metallo-hydrolase [Nocardioides mesophilus]QNN54004.1 MBL fold metallo-hydrolase [Nocardioides mesophilus]
MSGAGWQIDWLHGEVDEPLIQVHWYDDSTVILRQSKRTSFEAPFLTLLLGSERALLLDTGASKDRQRWPLRATVDTLLSDRPAGYELVVTHTHGHQDHTAGDAQFRGRPNTTVVSSDPEQVRVFFGMDQWPTRATVYDLGDRPITLIPSPGHHRAAITFYDPVTRILFTGDSILPGRIYVSDADAYGATLDRLADFCASHPVEWLFGCHVEVARDGAEYPAGRILQPDEAPPQLPVDHLDRVRDMFARTRGVRGVHRRDGIVIYNQPRLRDMAALQHSPASGTVSAAER